MNSLPGFVNGVLTVAHVIPQHSLFTFSHQEPYDFRIRAHKQDGAGCEWYTMPDVSATDLCYVSCERAL